MPTKKKRPVKIITLDTETIGLDGELKRIAIYDGERVVDGYTFDDMLPLIEDYYNRGFMPHVYIHNLDFDARKIPEIFSIGNVVWSRTKKIGNKFARITCRKYIIHDSYKILPKKLQDLSHDFEVEHGKLDLWDAVQEAYPGEYIDHVDFLSRCDRDNELYVRYLHYDVLSLYEVLQKLMEVAKLSEEQLVTILSTASLSRFLFKNGYGDLQFKFPDNPRTDFEILTSCKAWGSEKLMNHSNISYQHCELLMRSGFYGGRTEVFTTECKAGKPGEIVAYHYDVNSLYPSQMIDNDFPYGYPEFFDDENVIAFKWKKWMERKKGLGFITADVFVPDQTIPPLPAKIGKLVFVCGHISGTWTFNELEYAVRNCGVIIEKFHYMVFFQKTHKIFHNFVKCFYEMKNEGKKSGNESLTSFAKLILNTAYGWTVLRRDDKTAFRDIKDLPKWQNKPAFKYANEELGYFEIQDTVLTETIQVQVGAYVTSYARLVLLDALRKQAEIGTVYYCDTDSIVCSEKLPPEMVDKYELGKWDLEGELYSGLFLQPKVYTEDKKLTEKDIAKGKKENRTIKFKGVSKKRQKELKEKHYREIYALMKEDHYIEYEIEEGAERLPSLAVAMKNGKNPNQLQKIDKKIRIGTRQKRQFDFVNNTSKAWFMESLDEFEHFSFAVIDNPPDGIDFFGG